MQSGGSGGARQQGCRVMDCERRTGRRNEIEFCRWSFVDAVCFGQVVAATPAEIPTPDLNLSLATSDWWRVGLRLSSINKRHKHDSPSIHPSHNLLCLLPHYWFPMNPHHSCDVTAARCSFPSFSLHAIRTHWLQLNGTLSKPFPWLYNVQPQA